MYPRIVINLPKLVHNAKTVTSFLKARGISCFLVGKVMAGNKKVLSHLASCGFTYLADSRIQNLIRLKTIPLPKALLRIPMPSEVNLLIDWVDLVLVSELETIRKINQRAENRAKIIDIIVMFDLGDLREGIFYKNDYINLIEAILKLSHIRLRGIGTNLTCYGAIIPDTDNMNALVAIKQTIEEKFGIVLDIISGGNSSSFYLVDQLPDAVNNLRIGEAIFLGKETAFGTALPDCYQDGFRLEAEVVEVQDKPSYPIGTMTRNAFGEIPHIADQGWMIRGICAIGKQDVDPVHLTSLDPAIAILGASSDHLLLDCRKKVAVGDKLGFRLDYGGLLQVMTSSYVHKKIIKNE